MPDRAPTYKLGPDFHKKLKAFADKFLAEGFELFSKEFAGIEQFRDKAKADGPDRSDKLLRQTPREKYLLDAVWFHVYDELNREAFNRASDTIIILPDCLSLHNPDCIKSDEEYGDRCQQCVSDCQASEIVDLAEQYGVEAVFSKRKLSQQIEHYQQGPKTLGVIGIACLAMLAEGMRTAAEAGVPARGVLLNFTGCEYWNDEPFASAFPLARLRSILEEKYGQALSQSDD